MNSDVAAECVNKHLWTLQGDLYVSVVLTAYHAAPKRSKKHWMQV